jgi:hypothetical protein
LIPKDARKRLKKLTIEIPKDIHVYYDTFVDLCGGLQVGIYIVDEFLAGSDGTLLRFYVEAGQRKLGYALHSTFPLSIIAYLGILQQFSYQRILARTIEL